LSFSSSASCQRQFSNDLHGHSGKHRFPNLRQPVRSAWAGRINGPLAVPDLCPERVIFLLCSARSGMSDRNRLIDADILKFSRFLFFKRGRRGPAAATPAGMQRRDVAPTGLKARLAQGMNAQDGRA